MPLSFNFGPENDPELLAKRPKTPVTLLAGFLGAGKTTLLGHLLDNKHGLRIGVVVNDLASVNIDSQLLRRYDHGQVEVAELQNGCVCCSSAEDLFSAVQTIVMRSKDHPFEHILVELSGVGDPQAIRRNWALATECQLPAALLTSLARVITVVDASSFAHDWQDTRKALERNEAAVHDDSRPQNPGSQEMVGQLLANQVELADVLIVNKCDLATDNELQSTLHVLQALNGTAEICQTHFGRVPSFRVLPPVPFGLRIQEAGCEDGYSWTQTAREIQIRMPIEQHVKGKDIECVVRKRSLTLGFKCQEVVAGTLAGQVANYGEAIFEIEGSGPERQVLLCLEKKEPGMWNHLWKRSSPACGHQHCNGHCLEEKLRRAEQVKPKFQSFTFERRRPFSSKRLQRLLEQWQDALSSDCEVLDVGCCALKAVLRSKGFAWCDGEQVLHCHRWQSAGRCVSCCSEDYWWHHLSDEQRRFRCGNPGAEAEFRELQKKWHVDWGDCRQELVFIGAEMDQKTIVEVLDSCLLTTREFEKFKETTSRMKVPSSEFSIGKLFGNLEDTQEPAEDADTQLLRSLGVGCSLREAADFEAVD
eukprot:s1477_g4.t3